MSYKNPQSSGISLKKKFGQHFLRQQSVVDAMLAAVTITPETSLFEIGCGDGFLTKALLQTACARLWVFEIDHDWASYVAKQYADSRMTVFEEDILSVDFARFMPHKPWILLANLPYQITFPILYRLQQYRHILQEAVVMIQEEVAQKLLKTSGRGYGFSSLFFQHYFIMKPLIKIAPGAFYPPPAVYSRLLYVKPRQDAPIISDEDRFWQFIKFSFAHPRRTLKNNLSSTIYAPELGKFDLGTIRAEQLSMSDFLEIWRRIHTYST